MREKKVLNTQCRLLSKFKITSMHLRLIIYRLFYAQWQISHAIYYTVVGFESIEMKRGNYRTVGRKLVYVGNGRDGWIFCLATGNLNPLHRIASKNFKRTETVALTIQGYTKSGFPIRVR